MYSKGEAAMSPIHEISAAPHFPQAFRSSVPSPTRPEAIVAALILAAEGAREVEVTERDGEIYIEIIAN
jgi:hypothetical protein